MSEENKQQDGKPSGSVPCSPVVALSIRQPWAWLIVNGYKDIENRNWKTNFRGKILVHAAKGMTKAEYEDADDQETLQKIHELMALKEDGSSKLRIMPECRNLLAAIPGYDVAPNESGKRHAWFPWIECLGHIAVSELKHIGALAPMISRGGGY